MDISKKQSVELLPFHAINQFMRNDFRLSMIRSALSAMPNLCDDHRRAIERMTKKYVKVPGFRTSDKAPNAVKVIPLAEAFEKRADLAGAILAAWAESQTDLRQKIFDFLTSRAWEVLPLEADRVNLGGFFITWPKDEDFELLGQAYKEMNPDSAYSTDDVLLMVVWITMHLPYEMVEKADFQCIPKLEKEEKPTEG